MEFTNYGVYVYCLFVLAWLVPSVYWQYFLNEKEEFKEKYQKEKDAGRFNFMIFALGDKKNLIYINDIGVTFWFIWLLFGLLTTNFIYALTAIIIQVAVALLILYLDEARYRKTILVIERIRFVVLLLLNIALVYFAIK